MKELVIYASILQLNHINVLFIKISVKVVTRKIAVVEGSYSTLYDALPLIHNWIKKNHPENFGADKSIRRAYKSCVSSLSCVFLHPSPDISFNDSIQRQGEHRAMN